MALDGGVLFFEFTHRFAQVAVKRPNLGLDFCDFCLCHSEKMLSLGEFPLNAPPEEPPPKMLSLDELLLLPPKMLLPDEGLRRAFFFVALPGRDE